jgi:transposase
MTRPWAYPVELRERAVAACERLTVAEVARLFSIGERTLYEWRALKRGTESLEPLPHRSGNPPRVDAAGAEIVRQIIAEDPDATIAETRMYFVDRSAKSCSESSMARALLRLGLTRKKNP